MVLHVVGLGLGTEQDITLRGLAAIKKCKKVYLEAYTSILTVPKEKLEELYGVAIEIAHRELCESGIEPIIERARTEDVAMLVVGDPFGATTHCDLLARANKKWQRAAAQIDAFCGFWVPLACTRRAARPHTVVDCTPSRLRAARRPCPKRAGC